MYSRRDPNHLFGLPVGAGEEPGVQFFDVRVGGHERVLHPMHEHVLACGGCVLFGK